MVAGGTVAAESEAFEEKTEREIEAVRSLANSIRKDVPFLIGGIVFWIVISVAAWTNGLPVCSVAGPLQGGCRSCAGLFAVLFGFVAVAYPVLSLRKVEQASVLLEDMQREWEGTRTARILAETADSAEASQEARQVYADRLARTQALVEKAVKWRADAEAS